MNIQNITPQDLLTIAIRRKWLIVGIVVISLGLAWLFLAMVPKIYRSNTLIIVENQQIPESYVSAVVSGSVAERLTGIKQQVLSRAVLNQVIDDYSLLPKDGGTNESREELINGLRKNIAIEFKGQPGGSRIDAFTISFAHTSPETAMKVTAGLASKFIEENLKTREEQVAGTTEFLSNELERAKTSLDKQEHAIANFKREYIGELPSQIEANLQTLNRLEREQTTLSESIRHRLDRKTALDKMISAYDNIGLAFMESPREAMMNQEAVADLRAGGKPAGNRKTGGGDLPGVRLKELEQNLASMSAEYKDTYPDIILLRKEIAQVKAQIAEKQRLAPSESFEETEGSSSKSPMERKSRSAQAPVDPYLNELKRERDETEIGLRSLKEQANRLVEQIRVYQSRVERTPEREQALTVLQRDYENTKRNYQALLDKQLNAKISEDLERKQKAGKFRIVDPAHLPFQPESPDSTRVLLAGALIGCIAGYGIAFVLEMAKKGFSKVEDVESLLGLPVLASIPNFFVGSGNRSTRHLTLGFGQRGQIKAAEGKDSTAVPYKAEAGKQNGSLPAFSRRMQDDHDSSQQRKSALEVFRHELRIIVKRQPMSQAAEQFRVAATRLVLSSAGQKSTVVVVTSAVPGEGKSTTVSNLGYVLADDLGKSTLLIDCDFKRPVLHDFNNVSLRPGLVEAIYGDAQLEDCVHAIGDSRLRILPSGGQDHQLADIGKIPQINSFVAVLKDKFEFIIVDAPPILPLADMNLLASMADMLLVVIRVNSTPQEVVQQAIKRLQPSSRAGIILTACEDEKVPQYLLESYQPGRGAYHS